MNTTVELEIMPAEVAAVSTELSAPKETALAAFTPFQKLFAESASLLAREKDAVTTAQARELRLAMKKHRGTSKATKDNVKADILLAGRLADAYFNRIIGPLENAEARLDEIEKAAERAEAARKLELKTKRTEELKSVGVDGQFFPLGDMPDDAYAQFLGASKLAHETKLAADAKAEAERIEAERLAEVARLKKIEDERIERERIESENARLKAEREESERLAKIEREKAAAALAAAEESARVERERLEKEAAAQRKAAEDAARIEAERVSKEKAKAEKIAADKLAAQEAQAKKEREAIEAKAKAEREAAEKAARIEREKREALERAERERIESEKKAKEEENARIARAAAAPDREKLAELAETIKKIQIPNMSTDEGKKSAERIQSAIETLLATVRGEWKSLNK